MNPASWYSHAWTIIPLACGWDLVSSQNRKGQKATGCHLCDWCLVCPPLPQRLVGGVRRLIPTSALLGSLFYCHRCREKKGERAGGEGRVERLLGSHLTQGSKKVGKSLTRGLNVRQKIPLSLEGKKPPSKNRYGRGLLVT